jgi:predicted nucleotide-binding protein (sugar kinase/HSP70/actin superfamily)
MIVPGDSERGLMNLLKFIRRRANNVSWLKLVSSFRFGLAKLSALDGLEQLVHRMRAVEKTKGTVNRLFLEAQEAIDQAGTWASLKEQEKEYASKLTALPRNSHAHPLRIGVVGETYVLMDPFASRDLESELGKLGVEVKRRNFASRWLRPGVVSSGWKEEAHRAAMPYLKRTVGGEGWESVGEKVLCSQDYDGMVHLLPFTCMPEIIAQNILPSVKGDIPVLTLICDEQTGKQGMLTRLEAFVDLLNCRRQRSKDEALSRC